MMLTRNRNAVKLLMTGDFSSEAKEGTRSLFALGVRRGG